MTFKRPIIVTSLATDKFPFNDTSPIAVNLPPTLASDPTKRRAFAEISDAATTTLANVFTPPMVCALVVSTVLPFTPAIADAEMDPAGKLTLPATTSPFFKYKLPAMEASPSTNKRESAVRSPADTVIPFCAVNKPVATVVPVTASPLDTVTLPATDASDCAVNAPDAVRAATDVAPATVRPFWAVTRPVATVVPVTVRPLDTVTLPATDASDCAVNAPDAVRAATDVAPTTVSPFWAVTKPVATVVPVTARPLDTVAFPATDASD